MRSEDYMRKALAFSLKGRGLTSPNPMVGALVVKNKRVVGEGWHRRCGGPHAEVTALNKAGAKAKGATLYVTLEPCYHYGRTPPCVHKVITSGVKKVVIGMRDPNPKTNGKSVRLLRKKNIKVKVGLLDRDIRAANEIFIKSVTSALPFVVGKSAQTLDGKIAARSGGSKWITSEKARKSARLLRDDFDAVCVGINTVLKDDPRLTGVKKTKRLKKIIVDSTLKVPLKAKLFKAARPEDIFIAAGKKAPKAKLKILRNKGYNVIICPAAKGGLDLKFLFKALKREGIASILLEGGAHVLGSGLRQKLIDKMHIYVAPKIMGDEKALDSVTGLSARKLKETIKLNNVTARPVGPDLFISGYVHRHR